MIRAPDPIQLNWLSSVESDRALRMSLKSVNYLVLTWSIGRTSWLQTAGGGGESYVFT